MFLCYFLPEKDSKLRTKTSSSPALIRAYGRTYVRTDVTSKFSRLDGFTNFYSNGYSGARGNSANTILLGMYRPPYSRGANYYSILEEELNECLSWATVQCSTVIIMGDLNLDKVKINERDAKLLKDLEEVFELTCLITEQTRITASSQILLDVILTNQPDLFKTAGVINIGLSDHCMVYGFLEKAVKQHPAAVINCRSIKNLDINEFTRYLTGAVWITQHSTSVDEQYDNWYTEFPQI